MSQVTDGTVKFTVRDRKLNSLLDILYPVGSIKITVSSSAPFSDLGFGTWKEVSKGRVLWGADDSHSAGSTIEAGLPNITGNAGYYYCYTPVGKSSYKISGAFLWSDDGGGVNRGVSEVDGRETGSGEFFFDASRSSSIYGNSDTVTPPLTSFISGKGSVSPYLREVV